MDLDSGVRVAVVPSQSSYFAGEQFTVTITLTNIRKQSETKKRSTSSTHKRGSHSISSVPLARPPTSPVTPITAVPPLEFSRSKQGESSKRKGLIGTNRSPTAAASYVGLESKKSLQIRAHSQSVDISPKELNGILDPPTKSPKSSPHVSRNESLPLSSKHPHARKQSVLDGSLQLQEITQSSNTYFSSSASTSTSAFSLSLDPISENAPSAFPPTPSVTSPKPETTISPSHLYPPRLDPDSTIAISPSERQARFGGIGYGHPPNSHATPTPRTAFSSTFPQLNTELILYSYAQLVGTLTLSAPPGAPQSSAQAQMMNSLRHALLRRPVLGGGSMDISSSLQASTRPGHARRLSSSYLSRNSHTRSPSISSSILSYLSPSPSSPAQLSSPGHKSRSPSLISAFLPSSSASLPSSPISPSSTLGSPVGLGFGGLTMNEALEEIDPETPLPVFEVQPTMVAVDLTLGPGESRTYTYTLTLPENLPPTFRGRALKFSYQLHVGVCRSGTAQSGSSSTNSRTSTSRVMKVPIRVYNNVVETGFIRPYDFLWPLTLIKKNIQGEVAEDLSRLGVVKRTATLPSATSSLLQPGSLEGLQDYAGRLLSTFPDLSNGVRIKLPIEAISPSKDHGEISAGEVTGCREAVEILTRNPRKVSYDVNKDGIRVAVLTFVKSAYRLGETVLGVLELNERSNRARVLKLSASLEAHESLPSSLSSPSAPRLLRKIHAEHHASLIPTCLRTTFSLDIPSDATPAFQCEVGAETHQPFGSPAGLGGLEWKVRICLLVAVASETARQGAGGARVRHLVRDGPPGDWGSSWRATNIIAPLEYPETLKVSPDVTKMNLSPAMNSGSPTSQNGKGGWMAYLTSFLSPGEPEYHDGDEESEYDFGPPVANGSAHGEVYDETYFGEEEDWRELKIETVECEVPIKVWPGNTAFRAPEIVFDV